MTLLINNIKMKIALLAIITAIAARAELAETTLEWRPACDGAPIEVISDGDKIRGVRAFATHSYVIREWTIHYVDGISVSAEYRGRTRGKILKGDRAGENSGINPLKRLLTFKAIDGKFSIGDKELSDDLADILAKTQPKNEAEDGDAEEAP